MASPQEMAPDGPLVNVAPQLFSHHSISNFSSFMIRHAYLEQKVQAICWYRK